jgi:hypothetical protein
LQDITVTADIGPLSSSAVGVYTINGASGVFSYQTPDGVFPAEFDTNKSFSVRNVRIWEKGLDVTSECDVKLSGFYHIGLVPILVTLGGSKLYDGTPFVDGATLTTSVPGIRAEAPISTLSGSDVGVYNVANRGFIGEKVIYVNFTALKLYEGAVDVTLRYAYSLGGSYEVRGAELVPLTVTIGGSKTYDRTATVLRSLPGPTITSVGLVAGDSIISTFGNTSGVNVGNYNEAATILADVKVVRAGVDVTNKYDITKAGSFEITKAHQSKPTLVISPVTVPLGESASLAAAGGESSGAYVYRIASGNGMIVGSLVKPNEAGTVTVQVMRQGDLNYFDSDWSDAASVGAIDPVSVKITATARGEGVTIEKVSEGQYKIILPPQ